MLEFVFLLVFLGMLLFTGISMLTILGAMAVSFLVMFLAGMLGFALKLLPWLIVIAIVVWIYKGSNRGRRYNHYR
ncbi:envelope stress response protein PspG [Vibrio sp. JC009]|uniref:envelope stress response protein PspG n=1 Tax=Vibrio sp. JC009 TaxID=2912314 RepID=UPI0023B1676F|nr:envelope stress response protein PspG [Vibrio sp. JC009]WED21585.1 envelope stress response protein PspG [Vibrio sp. JC009]